MSVAALVQTARSSGLTAKVAKLAVSAATQIGPYHSSVKAQGPSIVMPSPSVRLDDQHELRAVTNVAPGDAVKGSTFAVPSVGSLRDFLRKVVEGEISMGDYSVHGTTPGNAVNLTLKGLNAPLYVIPLTGSDTVAKNVTELSAALQKHEGVNMAFAFGELARQSNVELIFGATIAKGIERAFGGASPIDTSPVLLIIGRKPTAMDPQTRFPFISDDGARHPILAIVRRDPNGRWEDCNLKGVKPERRSPGTTYVCLAAGYYGKLGAIVVMAKELFEAVSGFLGV